MIVLRFTVTLYLTVHCYGIPSICTGTPIALYMYTIILYCSPFLTSYSLFPSLFTITLFHHSVMLLYTTITLHYIAFYAITLYRYSVTVASFPIPPISFFWARLCFIFGGALWTLRSMFTFWCSDHSTIFADSLKEAAAALLAAGGNAKDAEAVKDADASQHAEDAPPDGMVGSRSAQCSAVAVNILIFIAG